MMTIMSPAKIANKKMILLLFLTLVSSNIYSFDHQEIDQVATRATVYIFLGTECPLSQNYTLTLNSLFEKYQSSGIEFIGVFPVVDDSKKKLKKFTAKYEIQFKVIRDRKYKLTNLYKAKITPEVVVLNSKQNRIYSGKINNWAAELGVKRSVITEHYLDDALHSYINDLPIKIPKTQAIGCFIHGHKSHQNHVMHGL